MSSAWALVRFPDGEVKVGLYFGTADLMYPRLITTKDLSEAWDIKDQGWTVEPEGNPEPVEIYSDYGGGLTWKGHATRNCLETRDCDPWDTLDDGFTHERISGQPQWATEWLDKLRVEGV